MTPQRPAISRILDRFTIPEGLLLLALAVLVGAATGLAAVVFIKLIVAIQNFSYGTLTASLPSLGVWIYLIVPILGGLLVGLLVTMGIGSSFSTIPIIAAIFVPLGVQLGFSPLAIVCIVGTAGALGDAGSPASDSTLGPTSGLNADGQHNHIWDSVVPTFLHYNLPLLAFGWAAAMLL